MGLRYVKGLGEREKDALAAAPPPYRSLADFVARTRMTRNAYAKLAEAGALDALMERSDAERPAEGRVPAGSARRAGRARARPGNPARRDALWAVRELHARLDDALGLPSAEGAAPRFLPLSDHEEVLWDYRRSHHSTRGHPIAGLREKLSAQGIPTAAELNARAHGSRVRYVGMTICRQRPGTASGVTFYTLEDETGFVNLVVWLQVFEQHQMLARTALLLGVTGRLQVESGVVHLIADELWEPGLSFDPEGTTTRNFH